MVVLEQLVELRVPAELRGASSKTLDAHIHKKILKPLSSTPHRTLAVGDDKAHPDLLEVGATFKFLKCLQLTRPGSESRARHSSLPLRL